MNLVIDFNPGIETRFERIDGQTFTVVIYRHGKAEARCCIRCGERRGFGSGITYPHDETSRGNSINESLSVASGSNRYR